ncbi:MAG: hypothetical protein CVV56_05400 [Tenericutes bacterium HGW-Tenericutes-1]|jgi:hypothetical protein|nr:MAG: hypothetical protein CVV56_05400 [Tenericutes bacterium HGW-Tenericutes-1]
MRLFKKFMVLSLSALVLGLAISSSVLRTDASSSTTYTYALDDDYEYVRTQDAYLPGQTITFLGLDAPKDITFNSQNELLIADSGNKRVVVYNTQTKTSWDITHPEMVNPQGLFAVMNTSAYITEGDIYVADPTAGKVFHFDATGTLLQTFGKPDSIMYETLLFQPEKIAVDKAGIMYVVSKGSSDGIVQLSNTGGFLGFFSANKVTLSLREQFQQFIYSDEQLADLGLNFTPPVFTSVFIDNNGIVYSSSSSQFRNENMKKHNTQGTNMLSEVFLSNTKLIDIFTDKSGIIYTADQGGWIDVYTNDGEFIYTFGGSYDFAIAGIFKTLASITVDDNGHIWTADSSNSYIQSFVPTDYANMIYEAINDYNETRYDESIAIWSEVLKLNQLSILAHNGIAKNYLQTEEYELAAYHFEIAGNRMLYSEAFWELRNIWLQEYLLLIIGLSLFGLVAVIAIKATDKRYHYLTTARNTISKVKNVRIINDILYMKNVATKPNDSFYYLRRKAKGSYLGATLILVLAFLSYLLFVAGKGFIFQFVDLKDMDLGSIILGFVVVVGLFIVCSYMITSIQDGEGTVGEIYKGVAYSFYPFILASISATLFSYVATTNELFLLNTIMVIGVAWTLLLIFISVSEIQNYSFGETIKSILLTIVFILVILLVLSFVQMTIKQLFVFFEEILKEGWRNVIG